jgi:hypothetical protein
MSAKGVIATTIRSKDPDYGTGSAAQLASAILEDLAATQHVLLGPDERSEARERLARHLHRQHWDGDPPDQWQNLPYTSTEHWLARADELLAVIAGKEG